MTYLAAVVRTWYEPWMEEARCAYVDPDMWFPEKGESGKNSVKYAKAICSTCPVIHECREYALKNGERFGIWAATTERERRALLGKAYPSEAVA